MHAASEHFSANITQPLTFIKIDTLLKNCHFLVKTASKLYGLASKPFTTQLIDHGL